MWRKNTSILSLRSVGISVFICVLFKSHHDKWILSPLLASNSLSQKKRVKTMFCLFGYVVHDVLILFLLSKKPAPKTFYYFKLLVVYELTLSPLRSSFITWDSWEIPTVILKLNEYTYKVWFGFLELDRRSEGSYGERVRISENPAWKHLSLFCTVNNYIIMDG